MTTKEANERLVADLKALARDTEELLRATASQTGERVEEIRRRLGSALESAKATCGRLQERTVEYAHATDRTIRDHPYEAIGAAFGVGLFVGILLARR
jgi:ElaB/YqjD/DUF883 family membrane-anchored ribosome-binding protein